jgi:uncharacterized membrane protein YfcA
MADVKPTDPPPVKAPTLADSHEMFIALAMMVGFVIGATIIAGLNQEVGRAMLGLMILLLIMQGITHVNPFTQWVLNHPLQPTGKG